MSSSRSSSKRTLMLATLCSLSTWKSVVRLLVRATPPSSRAPADTKLCNSRLSNRRLVFVQTRSESSCSRWSSRSASRACVTCRALLLRPPPPAPRPARKRTSYRRASATLLPVLHRRRPQRRPPRQPRAGTGSTRSTGCRAPPWVSRWPQPPRPTSCWTPPAGDPSLIATDDSVPGTR